MGRIDISTSHTQGSALDALNQVLAAHNAEVVRCDPATLEFTAGLFSSMSSTSPLVSIHRGRVSITASGETLVLEYQLSFWQQAAASFTVFGVMALLAGAEFSGAFRVLAWLSLSTLSTTFHVVWGTHQFKWLVRKTLEG